MAKKQKTQAKRDMASLSHAQWKADQASHQGVVRQRVWTQDNKRAARSKKACRGKVQW